MRQEEAEYCVHIHGVAMNVFEPRRTRFGLGCINGLSVDINLAKPPPQSALDFKFPTLSLMRTTLQ